MSNLDIALTLRLISRPLIPALLAGGLARAAAGRGMTAAELNRVSRAPIPSISRKTIMPPRGWSSSLTPQR